LDEYSLLLLGWLSESVSVSFPSPGYEQIYLTHDIDRIAYYRNPRGFLGGIKRNLTSFPGLKNVLKAPLRLANDPAYTFFCYIDADYVVDARVKGITPDTVLGHHGVGIFWNVAEWTIDG
jgi:hypothetical protein